jgi:glycerol-3-phosphate acyltransferase PlsY
MMDWLPYLLAYFLGAVPTSYIVGKIFFGKDLFQEGSCNIGATNAFRVLGKGAGAFVLLMDMGKGALPVLLARYYFNLPLEQSLYVGLCAVFGHTFSIFVRFKGGKGVATSAGILAALAPIALGTTLVFFGVVVKFSGYVSLGSILSALLFPALAWFIYPQEPLLWQMGAALGAYIIFKHRANIRRLVSGTENKFYPGGKNV